METLDMKGQPCPIPVVNAQKTLAGHDEGVVVLVDNFVAVQNLEKMAKGSGCGFSYVEDGPACYKVTILKGAAAGQVFSKPLAVGGTAVVGAGNGGKKGPVVLVTADSLGRGSDELGKLLIKGFLFSLTQLNPTPEAVIFLNGGARLTTAGANTVSDLKALEEKGTGIFTCGTCANYYKLADALAVGSIVDMLFISGKLAQASAVISL